MGIRNANYQFAYDGSAAFIDWTTTEQWLNEAVDRTGWEEDSHDDDDNQSVVDYALGAANPDSSFWMPIVADWEIDSGFDCLILPDPSAQFDPNTDAVDLNYWTGDIHDYDLILWRAPLADESLWEDYLNELAGDCLDDINACQATFHYSDAGHIFGGLPDWWEDVANGTWRGRIVILLDGQPNVDATTALTIGAPWDTSTDFFSGISTMTSLFINELTAAHGMELNVGERRTTSLLGSCTSLGTKDGAGSPIILQSTDCVLADGDPVATPPGGLSSEEVASSIMDGVDGLSAVGFLHDIEGGEPLAVQNGWFRDFCIETDTNVTQLTFPPVNPTDHQLDYTVPSVTESEQVSVARNVVVKNVNQSQYKVEYVICHRAHVTEPADGDYTDFHKKFVQNLLTKPLAAAS